MRLTVYLTGNYFSCNKFNAGRLSLDENRI